ncbi:MAG: helix-turn-helix domain-containing protein [Pyrinomonadaceae bacterium]
MQIRERMEIMVNELLDGRILLDEAINEFEKLYIQNALSRNSDHVSKTAAALGIHRNTLSKRLVTYKTPKTRPQSKKRPAISRAKKKSAGKG